MANAKHTAGPVLAKLLRAIASGSDAIASRHDLIFNEAAKKLDCHDDLLAALKAMVAVAELQPHKYRESRIEPGSPLGLARAALSKAQSPTPPQGGE